MRRLLGAWPGPMLAYDETIEARSHTAMRKLLQNTLFAALAALALYMAQAQAVPELSEADNLSVFYVALR